MPRHIPDVGLPRHPCSSVRGGFSSSVFMTLEFIHIPRRTSKRQSLRRKTKPFYSTGLAFANCRFLSARSMHYPSRNPQPALTLQVPCASRLLPATEYAKLGRWEKPL